MIVQYVVVISCEIGSKEEAMNNMPPSSQGSQINSEQDFGVRCPCGCNEVVYVLYDSLKE